MLLSRRSLLATAAVLPLVGGCAFVQKVESAFTLTDYLGEAAATFTAGAVAVTALTTLVQTGIVPKAKAQALMPYINAMAAEFATVKQAVDAGDSLGSAIIQAAQTALNGFQVAVAPVVSPVTAPQAQHAIAARLAQKKFAIAVGAIVTWVINNLGTLEAAGEAIWSLIQTIIGEYKSIVAGSTTVAQVDAAYQDFAADVVTFIAAAAS